MQISQFPLPSHASTLIEFRTPNVEDALLFCDLHESQEEANTTRFLNHMQDTSKHQLNDAGNWTGEDRRTALWWIFLATHEDKTVPFSYECKCGEEHHLDLNLESLMDTATVLPKLPLKQDEIFIQGKAHKVTVAPINGYAVEHIEALRNGLEMVDSEPERKRLANDMAIFELAHCLTFESQPEDNNEALEYKVSLIKTMHLNTEFRVACVLVENRLRAMRHGILCKYDTGRYYLVATIAECEKVQADMGGMATKTLLLPFHPNQYIATF